MFPQVNIFNTRNLNVLRDLGTLTIAGSEDLMRCQIDHTQALFACGSQQLKEIWSEISAAQTTFPWANAVQGSLRSTIGMARELASATSDYQAETLRLVQRQAIEVQDILADMLDNLKEEAEEATASREKRATKSSAVAKVAA